MFFKKYKIIVLIKILQLSIERAKRPADFSGSEDIFKTKRRLIIGDAIIFCYERKKKNFIADNESFFIKKNVGNIKIFFYTFAINKKINATKEYQYRNYGRRT